MQDSSAASRLSLSFGILALALWAVSWSWLVGCGITVVRMGEIGSIIAALAAVLLGAATSRRSRNVGLRCGVVALVLVLGLNLLATFLR